MKKTNKERRQRRQMHIRKTLNGTSVRPRVYVFRSNKYMYVSVSDDTTGKVLTTVRSGKSIDESTKVAKDLAKVLLAKKIDKVVFDRSGYRYHGRVKAVAEALRESGILA